MNPPQDSENNGEDNEEEGKGGGAERGPAAAAALRQSTSTVEVEAWTGGVQLPSEPAGICHPDLQAQIDRLYRKKVEQGYDMNTFIQGGNSTEFCCAKYILWPFSANFLS